MSGTDWLRGVAKREQQLAAAGIAPMPVRALRCPCVAIYSRCYCDLRKQTAR